MQHFTNKDKHCNDLAISTKRTQSVINRDFSKFIFQDTNLPFILFLQNVIHQRRFAGTQKARNDRNGCQIGLISCGSGHDECLLCFCVCFGCFVTVAVDCRLLQERLLQERLLQREILAELLLLLLVLL